MGSESLSGMVVGACTDGFLLLGTVSYSVSIGIKRSHLVKYPGLYML